MSLLALCSFVIIVHHQFWWISLHRRCVPDFYLFLSSIYPCLAYGISLSSDNWRLWSESYAIVAPMPFGAAFFIVCELGFFMPGAHGEECTSLTFHLAMLSYPLTGLCQILSISCFVISNALPLISFHCL